MKIRLTRPTSAAWSATAALLLTGAGVAAVAEPLTALRSRADPAPVEPASPVRAATVRIVLPPVAFAPVVPRPSPGTVRIALDDLDSHADDAALAAATIRPPVSAVRIAPEAVDPADPVQNLAIARAREMTAYSPTRYDTADVASPQSMSMVGDENWAALTRSYDPDGAPVSPTDRTAALRPPAPPSQALVGAVALDDEPGTAARLGTIDMPAPKYAAERVSLEVSARVNGATAGRVSLLIKDEANISIRLSDLLGILQPAVEPALYDRISGAKSAQGYLTFNELRAAGIGVDFDKHDRLILSTR